MSSFMKKLLEQKAVQSKKIQDKLRGEATSYMGDPALQWGVGGWIRGRGNLIYGPEKSGKSSVCMKAAGEEQKKTGGWVLIFDSEYNYKDPNEVDESGNLTEAATKARKRYNMAGLDPDKVFIISSNEVNVLFKDLSEFEKQIREGDLEVSAIIVDSWAGIQDEHAKNAISEGEISKAGNKFGGTAKTMGPIMQSLLRLSAENAVTLFIVQHCIPNMDQYGPRWILLGGQKLKYLVHCALFVETVAAKDAGLLADGTTTKENADGVRVGKKIRFRCEKSREVVEGRKGEFWMNFETLEFAKPEESLFNLATNLGIIGHPEVVELETVGPNKGQPKVDKKTGEPIKKINKMYWEFPVGAPTPQKFHGEAKTVEALKSDKDLFNAVYQACLSSTKESALTAGTEVSDIDDGDDAAPKKASGSKKK